MGKPADYSYAFAGKFFPREPKVLSSNESFELIGVCRQVCGRKPVLKISPEIRIAPETPSGGFGIK